MKKTLIPKPKKQGRFVRFTDAAWGEVVRRAGALGISAAEAVRQLVEIGLKNSK